MQSVQSHIRTCNNRGFSISRGPLLPNAITPIAYVLAIRSLMSPSILNPIGYISMSLVGLKRVSVHSEI